MNSKNKVKLILVGNNNLGKSSIICQFIENKFSEEYLTTINQDKSIKEIKLKNGEIIIFEIWDSIGQEEYRNVNKKFMKNTKIALLVYDITNQKSFEEL